jgi:hypothetical protein
MTCDISRWIQGDWHFCLFSPVVDLVGEPTFGLIVGAGLWAALYLASGGESSTPTVVVMLLGTIMFPALPAQFTGVAWSILVLGAAAALLQVLQRYLLDPSTQ